MAMLNKQIVAEINTTSPRFVQDIAGTDIGNILRTVLPYFKRTFDV
jgi:hypothetical protein